MLFAARRHLSFLVSVALLACAKNDKAASDTTVMQSEPSPSAPNVVTVTATDFAFEMPDTIPAGVTRFELPNKGKELHHAQIVQFTDGKTIEDYKKHKPTDPPPSWMKDMGGPGGSEPGGNSNATVELVPGNYALLCFVPGADGKPHFMKGMVMPFTVVAAASSSSPAALPDADVVARLTDYDFGMPDELRAGRHTFRVENGAQQPHELILFKLNPGKSKEDVVAWLQKSQGPPPITAAGGSSALNAGGVSVFTAELSAGDYVLWCFVPDAKDGKPHFMHGMAKQIKVT